MPTAITEWQTRYPTHSDVELAYSPQLWSRASSLPEKAYTADCPTLAQYAITHGSQAPVRWLHIQLLALYGSSSNTDQGIADGIPLFAATFAREVRSYKLSEILLFFARYKAGRYDSSYYSFDTRRIGNAFFREFLPERQRELDHIMKDEEQRSIEARRFTPPEGYTSLSWYQELKQRASQGDQEAITLLTQPPQQTH